MKKTVIIYLIGKPGVGKHTIATELQKHGYLICDNQLANNPIFQLLNYDGYSKIPEYAWNAIKKIRDAMIEFLEIEKNNNYVLTNVLNHDEGDRALYYQVKNMAEKRHSHFIPVKLTILQNEHLKRIANPERRKRWKSIDANDVYDTTPLLSILHENLLELNVTKTTAIEAANKILSHIDTKINQ